MLYIVRDISSIKTIMARPMQRFSDPAHTATPASAQLRLRGTASPSYSRTSLMAASRSSNSSKAGTSGFASMIAGVLLNRKPDLP